MMSRLGSLKGIQTAPQSIQRSVPQFGKMGENPIIDHRGAQICSEKKGDVWQHAIRVENTLLAFQKSFELGHDIELDVNINSLGEPNPDKQILPVFHDDHLGSPFQDPNEFMDSHNGKWIREIPSQVIQNTVFNDVGFNTPDIGFNKRIVGFNERVIDKRLPGVNKADVTKKLGDFFENENKIPMLSEVFNLFEKYPDSKTHIYVELKTKSQFDGESLKPLVEKVLALIKEKKVQDRVTVISFNPKALKIMKELAIRQGLTNLTTAWDIEPGLFVNNPFFQTNPGTAPFGLDLLFYIAQSAKVDAILPAYEETTESVVNRAHNQPVEEQNGLMGPKLKVLPWVYNQTRDQEIRMIPKLKAMGVDGVITNVPLDAERAWDPQRSWRA